MGVSNKIGKITHLRSNQLETSELSPCFLVNNIFHLRVNLCKRGVEDLVLKKSTTQ